LLARGLEARCELTTILKMKTLQRQPAIHAAAWNVHLYKFICLVHSFFHHLASSLMAINFIRISPTGSVPSTLPLTHDQKLENDHLQALSYKDDADLRHWHVLNDIYRFELTRQGILTPHTEIEQN
jgi:hypothetical protein